MYIKKHIFSDHELNDIARWLLDGELIVGTFLIRNKDAKIQS